MDKNKALEVQGFKALREPQEAMLNCLLAGQGCGLHHGHRLWQIGNLYDLCAHAGAAGHCHRTAPCIGA